MVCWFAAGLLQKPPRPVLDRILQRIGVSLAVVLSIMAVLFEQPGYPSAAQRCTQRKCGYFDRKNQKHETGKGLIYTVLTGAVREIT